MGIRKQGHRVPPMSTKDIRELATKFRKVFDACSSSRAERLDIVGICELVLPKLIPGFEFEVCSDLSMGGDHGRTYPDKAVVQVSESVYMGALNGNGRDRFTLAHELGHLFLHQGVTSYARAASSSINTPHKPYEDSEWQADQFSAELLMPYELCRGCVTPDEIMFRFGVSYEAAKVRYSRLKK